MGMKEQKRKVEQLGFIRTKSKKDYKIYYYNRERNVLVCEDNWEDYLAGSVQEMSCRDPMEYERWEDGSKHEQVQDHYLKKGIKTNLSKKEEQKKAEQLGFVQYKSTKPETLGKIYYYHPTTKKSFWEGHLESFLEQNEKGAPNKE